MTAVDGGGGLAAGQGSCVGNLRPAVLPVVCAVVLPTTTEASTQRSAGRIVTASVWLLRRSVGLLRPVGRCAAAGVG